ncbi:hypothetical protein FHG87_018705 [Trinorchestia longiramus]|nr:hypothetical protein FHG87_018705 [Trinorchestia longiramus]
MACTWYSIPYVTVNPNIYPATATSCAHTVYIIQWQISSSSSTSRVFTLTVEEEIKKLSSVALATMTAVLFCLLLTLASACAAPSGQQDGDSKETLRSLELLRMLGMPPERICPHLIHFSPCPVLLRRQDGDNKETLRSLELLRMLGLPPERICPDFSPCPGPNLPPLDLPCMNVLQCIFSICGPTPGCTPSVCQEVGQCIIQEIDTCPPDTIEALANQFLSNCL